MSSSTSQSSAPDSLSRLITEHRSVINQSDLSSFSKLVKHICNEFPCPLSRFLSNETSLNINDENKIIPILFSLFQEASFQMIKIPVFAEKLNSLGIDYEKCDVIIKNWSSQAKNIFKKSKTKTVLPLRLVSVESSFHQQMSSYRGPNKTLKGLFHFRLNTDGSESCLTLEFSKEDLFSFYETLEVIQNNLDQIV